MLKQTKNVFYLDKLAPVSDDLLAGGAAGIALMRLLIQCQDPNKRELLSEAFEGLPTDERSFLSYELALTGTPGETFNAAPQCAAGPAVLLYYLPAYVRFACLVDGSVAEASGMLRVVIEVLRVARLVWPRGESEAERARPAGFRAAHSSVSRASRASVVRSRRMAKAGAQEVPCSRVCCQ